MRVTNWMLLNSAIYDLSALREKYANAQKAVNGRSLERPSEDPQRVVEAMDLAGLKVRLERAQRAGEDAREWLSVTETSLSAMIDQLQSAQEIAIQAGSPASNEPTALANLASTIESIRDGLLREMNTQHRGRYLYAGWATDTRPFVDNGTGGVNYAAVSSDYIIRDIAPSFGIPVNVPGNQLQATGDMIDMLSKMADDLRAGNISAVTTTHLDKVKTAMDNLVALRSGFGLQMKQVEQYEQYTREGLINVEQRLGKISGGDLAESVLRMTEAQQAYQAAIASFSKALPVSLLDYMLR
ncbi:MAG: flagellin [Bacillota bacterium]